MMKAYEDQNHIKNVYLTLMSFVEMSHLSPRRKMLVSFYIGLCQALDWNACKGVLPADDVWFFKRGKCLSVQYVYYHKSDDYNERAVNSHPLRIKKKKKRLDSNFSSYIKEIDKHQELGNFLDYAVLAVARYCPLKHLDPNDNKYIGRSLSIKDTLDFARKFMKDPEAIQFFVDKASVETSMYCSMAQLVNEAVARLQALEVSAQVPEESSSGLFSNSSATMFSLELTSIQESKKRKIDEVLKSSP